MESWIPDLVGLGYPNQSRGGELGQRVGERVQNHHTEQKIIISKCTAVEGKARAFYLIYRKGIYTSSKKAK